MLRLLKWAVALAALAAVVAFVPVGGRSLRDRWRAARSPSEFVEHGLAEIQAAWQGKPRPARARPSRAPSVASGRSTSPHGVTPRAGRAPASPPTEQHTDAERSALDRVVAEHVGPSTP